jgi:hypothetical protein
MIARCLLVAAALARPMPALAATTSADLEAVAKVLEQNPGNNAALNTQLLGLLREPVDDPVLKGPGLRMEAFAWGKGNCASVTSAAIARAYAYKLRQLGR